MVIIVAGSVVGAPEVGTSEDCDAGAAEVDASGDEAAEVCSDGEGAAEVGASGVGAAEVCSAGDGAAEVDSAGDGAAEVAAGGDGAAEVAAVGDGAAVVGAAVVAETVDVSSGKSMRESQSSLVLQRSAASISASVALLPVRDS